MRRPWLIVWAFVFWTALGLFFASQIYLLGDQSMTWSTALRWGMPQWYIWGLLAPAVAVVERRIGRGRPIGVRLALHVPMGIAWTLFALSIRLCIRPLIGNTWPQSIWRYALERFK
jgi:hypothetical protein